MLPHQRSSRDLAGRHTTTSPCRTALTPLPKAHKIVYFVARVAQLCALLPETARFQASLQKKPSHTGGLQSTPDSIAQAMLHVFSAQVNQYQRCSAFMLKIVAGMPQRLAFALLLVACVWVLAGTA